MHRVARREALESAACSSLSARQDVAQGMCNNMATGRGVIAELPRPVLVIGIGVTVPEPPPVKGGLQGLRRRGSNGGSRCASGIVPEACRGPGQTARA
eukprot:7457096-Alexandrium_andersonii.AAC.1